MCFIGARGVRNEQGRDVTDGRLNPESSENLLTSEERRKERFFEKKYCRLTLQVLCVIFMIVLAWLLYYYRPIVVCFGSDGKQGRCMDIFKCPFINNYIKEEKKPVFCELNKDKVSVCCVEEDMPMLETRRPTNEETTKDINEGTDEYKIVFINSSIRKVPDINNNQCEPLTNYTNTGRISFQKCLEYQDKLVYPCMASLTPNKKMERMPFCNWKPEPMISDGTPATFGEFPHMALLGYDSPDNEWQCDGVIVSDRFILTAAHCAYSKKAGVVKRARIGFLKKSRKIELDELYNISEIYKHPQYKSPDVYNDIALLKTERIMILNRFRVPACLHDGSPINDSTVIVTGWGAIDPHQKWNSDVLRKRQCISYLEVCCGHKSILPEDTLTTTQKQPKLNAHDIINFKEEELLTTPATTSSEDKMEKNLHSTGYISSQCGWDVPSLFVFPKNDSAIYANYGEFPWAVALIKKKPTKTWSPNDYLGGGTLIHPSVVLTVAHKVDKINAQKIKIRAGEWDTQTDKEKHQYQERNVKKILIHPHFFKTSLYFDVALLITESPFDLAAAPHIKPACLGTSLPSPGTECFSMGWGPDFNNEDKYATILKKIQLPLVGSEDCTEKLQQSRLGSYFRIHSSLTCAGGKKGIDTCQGDGGSALVCPTETKNNSTRYVAYGLVAYGIDCGIADRPGVYANIPAALEWINQEMTKQNYGTGTYTA